MKPIFAVLGARALGALAACPASRRERLRFFLMIVAGKAGWKRNRGNRGMRTQAQASLLPAGSPALHPIVRHVGVHNPARPATPQSASAEAEAAPVAIS